MQIKISPFKKDGIPLLKVSGLSDFDIGKIFDCGQCFRFDPVEMTEHKAEFEGVAYGRYIRIIQDEPDEVIIYNSTEEDYNNIWKKYFSLDMDYSHIRKKIGENFCLAYKEKDKVMPKAMKYAEGIRILRQEPWETVCSFIISQNNNIPRIKKIISEMSKKYGEPIKHGALTYYAFPTAEVLYRAGERAIFDLKTGFRAKYIYDAAKRVSTGETSLEDILKMPSEEVEAELLKIKGVGPKVAACAMLFGFGKTEAFPIDVWIKRVLQKYYPLGLDIQALGEYAGIAQQYLFYYERYNKV